MKGISTVIATILMLMIAIALASVAYMYVSGMFTTRTATAISLASVDCTNQNIYLMIKNDGTEAITLTDIDISVDGGAVADCVAAGTVAAGQVVACDAIASTVGSHTVRTVGPSNAFSGSVYCS